MFGGGIVRNGGRSLDKMLAATIGSLLYLQTWGPGKSEKWAEGRWGGLGRENMLTPF